MPGVYVIMFGRRNSLLRSIQIVVYLLLGSPERVRWLSPSEKLNVKVRILSNKTNTHEVHKWDWSQALECLKDPQVYFAFFYMLTVSLQLVFGALYIF